MTSAVLPSVPTPFAPYTLRLPEGAAIPLICDSPHSGVLYPDDFGYALPFVELRSGEDTDVVATRAEAFRQLGLRSPAFEPVAPL